MRQDEKRCNMKKSVTWKKGNTKSVQHKKMQHEVHRRVHRRYNIKTVQHEKRCDMKSVQYEKSSRQKKCNTK